MLNLLVGRPAIWLLSNPKIKDMWYDKLTKFSEKDISLKDIDVSKIGADTGICLALIRHSISPQQLSLIQMNCNEKRFVICRIEPPREPKPKSDNKLPCLADINNARRKRSNAPGPKGIVNERQQHENGKCCSKLQCCSSFFVIIVKKQTKCDNLLGAYFI